MSLATIEQVIQTRLKDNWTDTPIDWQNTEFLPTMQEAFVRVTIIPGSEDQIGIGDADNMYRKVGVVFFSVFVPKNEGSRPAWTHVDNLMVLFRGLEVSGIRFRNSEFNEVGEAEGWFQVNLSIAFESDEYF